MEKKYPKTDNLIIVAKALCPEGKSLEIENLEFISDEYHMMVSAKSPIHKNVKIFKLEGEAVRRIMGEDQNDETQNADDGKELHEKSVQLYPVRVLMSVEKNEFKNFIEDLVKLSADPCCLNAEGDTCCA